MADPFDDLIEPFNRRGVDLGLDRLQAALAELGHPEASFMAVQVAGTNGKGSISTFVHAALQASGIRTGLYISPHLLSWCERIRIGAELIGESALRQRLFDLQDLAKRHLLTPFELVTAAAFCAFAEAQCPLVVLEVGLGGRLDATTCHPNRSVVGFGPIGLDHREFLGSTLAAIATEKAGVLRPGTVAISAAQNPEVAEVLEQQAGAIGAELRWVKPLDLGQWDLGIPGELQASNGAVALGMLQALKQAGWPIKEATIRQGFACAHWPGRLQTIHWRGHSLLVDGAHNPPAARALRQELDNASGQTARRFVLGMLAHKQAPEMLRELLGPDDRAWIVPVPGHPSWNGDSLRQSCPELAEQLHTSPDWQEALGQAWASGAHQSSPEPVVVAGSLYLIGHLIAATARE
ncbi:bifunctional folylpolyglutamate synthase/dihydrofolate synthase [Cyanobium sp. HWJ4-Hawea]|uniref:bifunctional folylpolyglutamate synthase/dihydrofolate synthase n=1 Tax=Cyanobium sp. HWJ4-Hawea TaxID=2823713 RepID=UPI0020CB6E7B|nr:cyanophycin synthetase [Cyanobium sp. HWJ4-Hawea]MCP9807904.1 bifunctional folylpolyglutamate synthase/dihydrofolate synthase [Cyanobium sp. HWJ4-Hawea]